ncbi:MAG: class IV adenylate cyclase [Candidatus Dojkabacteria bacterium]|nr:class IV adenylate cyclase [Candidatus Dojkabacteria bacterium]MDQ7020706.1 class IV adenylate cyclase [Candidatus Dojkabacteria bacterium]
MGKELEIKFSLEDKDYSIFQDWLKNNAEAEGREEHEEWYINNPASSFNFDRNGLKDADNYFRIRKTNQNEASVTLKLWQPDPEKPGHHTHCIEHEFKTSDLDSTRDLFQALGYTDITKVIKSREIYNYDVFEIVIDNVKELGIFIEVELKEEFNDPKAGHRKIKLFLKDTGIEKIKEQTRGYVSMFWNPEHDHGVTKYMKDY